MDKKFDVIVIGGGAAGMTCAAVAGQRKKSVLVLDHAKRVGEKIRISGGGRCNFTNIGTSSKNFICQNPHFPKSALGRYTPSDFISLVESYGIAWHEKAKGQLFCDGAAQQIIDMLLGEMRAANVVLKEKIKITLIEKNDVEFVVSTSVGEFHAPAIVVACGGKSIPKIGASGFGFELAKQFGLKIVDPAPALVPLTFSNTDLSKFRALAGVSVPVRVSCNGTIFEEDMLFTHRGLSGPAILQISSFWQLGDSLNLQICPEIDFAQHIRNEKQLAGRKAIQTVLAKHMPKRLATEISDQFGYAGNIADMNAGKF